MTADDVALTDRRRS